MSCPRAFTLSRWPANRLQIVLILRKPASSAAHIDTVSGRSHSLTVGQGSPFGCAYPFRPGAAWTDRSDTAGGSRCLIVRPCTVQPQPPTDAPPARRGVGVGQRAGPTAGDDASRGRPAHAGAQGQRSGPSRAIPAGAGHLLDQRECVALDRAVVKWGLRHADSSSPPRSQQDHTARSGSANQLGNSS